MFDRRDAERIMSIHISSRLPPDKRIWLHTKSGLFTVRSAYYWSKNKADEQCTKNASSSCKNTAWKQMWKLRIIPKVKHFLWRACNESLPTKNGLARRGLQIDTVCELCGEANESTTHLFLECQATLPIWYLSTLRLDLRNQAYGSFKNFLWTMLHKQSVEYVEMLSLIAWRIWLARNKWCMEKKKFDIIRILDGAQLMLMEMHKTSKSSKSESRAAARTRWTPPPIGILKMNSDVAKFNDGTVGYGFVIRDHSGDVLLAGTRREQRDGSSTAMEGLAIIFAIRSALEAGFMEFQIESDSKCLIDSIQGKGGTECSSEVVVGDVRHFAKAANCKEIFMFIGRLID
ncbi:hypothetical protein DH2020_001842 [Rehmannia glutinosa]|uniref:Reverse transcriptase zinc-binding domain-containing protein n=1 Tax=Rehmannia glutinosa TaxID=99300 RepID=A0ABR0XSK7_REHGL